MDNIQAVSTQVVSPPGNELPSTSVTATVAQPVLPDTGGNKPGGTSSDSVEISKTGFTLNASKENPVTPIPEMKIPSVEKLIEKIKDNGFPFESSFYKAVKRMYNEA